MTVEADVALLKLQLRLRAHRIPDDPTTTDPVTLSFLLWLAEENGYLAPRVISGARYAAVRPLMFSGAVITGPLHDQDIISDQWCYANTGTAEAALKAWDGEGEPEGWHRHPRTGRRVALEGDHYDDDGHLVPMGRTYVRF